MTIQLTPDQETFVQSQVKTGQYQSVEEVLSTALRLLRENNLTPVLDAETQTWLNADLGENLPPYEWGEEGEPVGKPIYYVKGLGFMVDD